jgi:hypothetical protein
MQGIRRHVAVASLFAVLGFSGSAIAAPQKDIGTRVRDAQSQLQQQMSKLKGRSPRYSTSSRARSRSRQRSRSCGC